MSLIDRRTHLKIEIRELGNEALVNNNFNRNVFKEAKHFVR
jgi:hypothetical protein